MKWWQRLFGMLPLIPAVVVGIEAIHGDAKKGAEKKQLALEALGLASNVASTVLPAEQEAVGIATTMASTLIDGSVALFNKQGWPSVNTATQPAH
jgi:hypothetical protein